MANYDKQNPAGSDIGGEYRGYDGLIRPGFASKAEEASARKARYARRCHVTLQVGFARLGQRSLPEGEPSCRSAEASKR